MLLPGLQGCWLFIVFSLLLLLNSSCHPKVDPSLLYGPDGQPRIVSVQLNGIPDQNIQINQETKKIIITVPASFSTVVVPTHFQLTQDARVTSRSDSLYVYPLNPNDTVKLVTGAQKTNAYEFIFKSTDEVRFANSLSPLVFTVHPYNNNFCIPLYTSANGKNSEKATFTITNRLSGRQIAQQQYISVQPPGCEQGIRSDEAVYASIYLSGQQFYEPGDYNAELVTASGYRAVLNQPIRLQRGEIALFFPQEDSIVLSDTTLTSTISAANLFPADKPSFMLRARGQKPVAVQPVKFYKDFNRFDLPIIKDIQPGYYYAQLLMDGKLVDNFVRIPVVRSIHDLVIQSIYDPFSQTTQPNLDASLPFTTPIAFKRNKRYEFTTNSYTVYLYKTKPGDGTVSRIRLTSLSDPNLVYLVPIDENPNLSGNLQFPSTIAPGLYQLKFEILTSEKTLLSSEPLERDVQIE